MVRRPLPSLKGLQALEAFARTRSMTRAAAELSVTHGAVSRQIKALEERLGATLVAGPRHRLALTPAGQTLADALALAFDGVAAALPGSGDGEDLTVACVGALAMKWLIPRMPGFQAAHPQIRIRIIERSEPADFAQAGLHAGIALWRGPPRAGVRALPFLGHFHGPVLSPVLFAEAGRDADRLLALPRLSSDTYPDGWALWAADARVALPPASAERTFEHNAYLLEAAAAGMGVAVTAWAYAQADIEQGRLIAPWGFHPLAARFAYLRPARTDNAAAAAFGQWLLKEGRRSPPPSAPMFSSVGALS